MHFVPLVIGLTVVPAHSVHAYTAADRRWRDLKGTNDFGNDEGLRPSYVVHELKHQIALFVVDADVADVAFGHDMRLCVEPEIGNRDSMKIPVIQAADHDGWRCRRTGTRLLVEDHCQDE